MQKEKRLIPKTERRKALLELRAGLNGERRREAVERLMRAVLERTERRILSFVSFGSEIHTHELNRLLAAQGKLVLPRREGDTLGLYAVQDPTQLQGIEPILERCERVQEVDLALIPGLGFDALGFRLGYGKGYYDRLLSTSNFRTIGVGFLEQQTSFPHDPWDQPVHELFLT